MTAPTDKDREAARALFRILFPFDGDFEMSAFDKGTDLYKIAVAFAKHAAAARDEGRAEGLRIAEAKADGWVQTARTEERLVNSEGLKARWEGGIYVAEHIRDAIAARRKP